jgi:hypothetical protein
MSFGDDGNLEKHQKEALEFSKNFSSKEQEWLHLTGWWVGNVKFFEKVRKIKIINKRDILYDHLELIKQAINNAENPLVCFGTQQEEGKGKATEGKNSGEKERKKTIEKEREEKKEKERKKRLELKSAGKKEEEGVADFRQHSSKPFFTSDFNPNPAAAKNKKAYRAQVLEQISTKQFFVSIFLDEAGKKRKREELDDNSGLSERLMYILDSKEEFDAEVKKFKFKEPSEKSHEDSTFFLSNMKHDDKTKSHPIEFVFKYSKNKRVKKRKYKLLEKMRKRMDHSCMKTMADPVNGASILYNVCGYGNYEDVKYCLTHFKSLNYKEPDGLQTCWQYLPKSGYTALHHAILHNNEHGPKEKKKVMMLLILFMYLWEQDHNPEGRKVLVYRMEKTTSGDELKQKYIKDAIEKLKVDDDIKEVFKRSKEKNISDIYFKAGIMHNLYTFVIETKEKKDAEKLIKYACKKKMYGGFCPLTLKEWKAFKPSYWDKNIKESSIKKAVQEDEKFCKDWIDKLIDPKKTIKERDAIDKLIDPKKTIKERDANLFTLMEDSIFATL